MKVEGRLGTEMDRAPTSQPERSARSRFRIKRGSGTFGILLVLAAILSAVLAPWLAPADPNRIDLANRLAPPTFIQPDSPGGVLGRDNLGRDILSRILYGARVSILVGFATIFISGIIGTTLGLIAGYKGGRVDSIVMGVADIIYVIPFLVLVIAVAALLGGGTLQIILYLGFANWISFARIVRGKAFSIREEEYVLAARSMGAGDLRIMFRHILPNAFAPVVVVAALGIGSMVLAEAALSFLGVGVPPSIPSWGRMVSDSRDYVRVAWWPAFFPGLAIMSVVLGINLFGDWLRDALDPRLRT